MGEKGISLQKRRKNEVLGLFLEMKMTKNAYYVRCLLPYVLQSSIYLIWYTQFHISIKCQNCFEVLDKMRKKGDLDKLNQ